MRLAVKLTLTLVALSIVMAGVSTAVVNHRARHVLEDLALNKLQAIRRARSDFILTYLDYLQSQSRNFAKNLMVLEATREFAAGFDAIRGKTLSLQDEERLRDHFATKLLPAVNRKSAETVDLEEVFPQSDASRYLQLHYLVDNPHSLDEKHLSHSVKDGTRYAAAHDRYHSVFEDFRTELGYIDLMIVDPKTDEIVYTVRKGADLGANLDLGTLNDTKLASAVRKIRDSKTSGMVEFVDFEPWLASYGIPSFFVVTGVFSGEEFLGTLVLQVSDSIVDQVVGTSFEGREADLGRTGEIFLVGSDSFLRSESRFLGRDVQGYLDQLQAAGGDEAMIRQIERTGTAIGSLRIPPALVRNIFDAKEGTFRGRGMLGQEIVASFGRIDFGGLSWGIVTAMDSAEVAATLSEFRTEGLGLFAFAIVLAGLVSSLAGRALTRPLRQTIIASRAFANGFYEVRLPVRSSDEIAQLAMSFNEMASEIESKTSRLKTVIDENERLMEHMMPPLVLARFHHRRPGRDDTPYGTDITLAFFAIKELDRLFEFFDTKAALAMFEELLDSFDEAAVRLGMEKLGHVGTGYMVGCGLSDSHFDHTTRVLTFAQEIEWIVEAFNAVHLTSVHLKIGVHRGPISSGRLSRHQFVNDLWRRTIELAKEIDPSVRKSGVRVSKAARDRVEGNPDFAFAEDAIDNGESGWTLLSFVGKKYVDA